VSLYGATQDWHSHRPVTPVGPRLSTITLPAFDTVTINWRGAAEIARQYQYTATGRFALLQGIQKPAFATEDVAFSLAIKYRVGETVYRYKLWEHDNDAISGITWNLYNGEIIKPNFCLEIWTLMPRNLLGDNPDAIAAWDVGTQYGNGDLVKHNGVFYRDVNQGSIGIEPGVESGWADYWDTIDSAPALEDDIVILTGLRSLPTYPYSMARQAQAAGSAVTYAQLQQSLSVVPIAFGSASSWLSND
jgi:hypothetical protein